MTRNGVGGLVVSIDRPLETLHFHQLKKILKGPGPLTAKTVFRRLNNSPCNLIESSTQRCKKHNSGWFSVQIRIDIWRLPNAVVFDAGRTFSKSNLFMSSHRCRYHLRWEPHKFSSGYMHKKSAKRKYPVKNPRKLKEKSRFKTRVGYLIQSGYMKSCLAAQKRVLLFKGLGSFKQL